MGCANSPIFYVLPDKFSFLMLELAPILSDYLDQQVTKVRDTKNQGGLPVLPGPQSGQGILHHYLAPIACREKHF